MEERNPTIELVDIDYEERYEELAALVEAHQLRTVREIIREWPEVDIAWFLEELATDKMVLIFRMLPKELAAETFAYLDVEHQQHIVIAITASELTAIVEELAIDDAVDILEELPASVVHRVLKSAAPETRALINQYLKYPENSAGSLMTAEFVNLRPSMTVEEAFAHIRVHGADSETIYTCYVIDRARHLLGFVTVKDLLLSDKTQTIEEIMDDNVIYCSTSDDQSEVTQIFSKYGFMALPVVDAENRLVGIVTVDDVITVIEDEATEDMEMMAAITPSEKDYLHTGVWETWKQRIPWLLVLMLSATFTQAIINSFEAALASCVILTAYIPMLMGTGGNCSSQSSVTVIRGLSLGDIEFGDLMRVLWKELRVSLLCGCTLGIVNFIKLMLLDRLTFPVAAVVSLTLVFTIMVAKLVGGVLPMLAKKIKLDPAVMASPFITTIVDAVSLLIYFRFASLLLGI